MSSYIPPPDKSITIRALLLGAAARGRTVINNPLFCGDTAAALNCLRALGVRLEVSPRRITVHGRGSAGFTKPRKALDAAGSGTVARLLAGLLAGLPFNSALTGNAQLKRRPMARVTLPLRRMGAAVRDNRGRLPLSFSPARLRGIKYASPVASAQVKSALLLAALNAEGPTSVSEPAPSRDHTERLLRYFLGRTIIKGCCVTLTPSVLKGRAVRVPGDISAAAPFIAAALLAGRELKIRGVGLNPSRLGFIRTLRRMGARISLKASGLGPEPSGTMLVRPGRLKGITVAPREVPAMIDELPVLAVIAAAARGRTAIRGAGELRHKESDRIKSTLALLKALGAEASFSSGVLSIAGGTRFKPGRISAAGDHRIAMAAAAAAAIAGEVSIAGADCVAKSYPLFFEDFGRIFK